ncbi:sensor histidine kinase [Microbispora triticiradicis]|uniref:Oxygen sensor histidine kinase NreB n=1 Tax=Microbispora triticiradicis TaxID=2200763 RepID=A0ABX9L924_9ACTN|nr:sensor histidine kinase [Microbispora triticiradicis]RGA00243.1 sensor histidine kinase [Microbispora triticiradicis]
MASPPAVLATASVPTPACSPAPHASGRPVPWVAPVLYAAVLAGGLYYDVAGDVPPSPAKVAAFVAGLVTLSGLDVLERRRHRVRTPKGLAAALLGARLALFAAVAAADTAGLSRVLFVLLPFSAYFAFGRRVAVALAAGCLGLLIAWLSITVPGWHVTAAYVSDVLMFGLGLVLAVSMAAVAVGEQESRTRLEHALYEVEESHARLTAYADRVAELTAAEERNRLAREIHDSLGHHLTAAAVQMEKAEAFLDRDRATAERALADARSSAARALGEVRHSVRALRGEAGPFRLSEALAELVRRLDGGGPRVTLETGGDESGYDAAALRTLYRAAQEALTNAFKHAAAGRVAVSVTCGEARARLVVEDDGGGLPPGPREERGFGLRGMRERVRLAGGDVSLTSEPGRGTTVTVTVPREPAGAV